MRGWLVVPLLVVAAPAHARHSGPQPLAASLEVGAAQLSLAGRVFGGSGHAANFDGSGEPSPATTTLRVTGSQLAPGTIIVADIRLHVSFLLPGHVALGGVFGGVWGDLGRGLQRVDGAVIGSTVSGVVLGGELATAWAFGPLSLRAGFVVGYRSVDVPILSFALEPCGRGGRCYPSLGTNEVLVEPRVSVALTFYRGLGIGAYAGGDLAPGGGWSAGAMLSGHSDLWDARAQALPVR
jgi:hypothetical protein